ncbi:MAG: phage tail sheath family protein [Symploca sp. SIO1B1]|nr:phage tail sheath family protein [Symploca sp. SIO1B1]
MKELEKGQVITEKEIPCDNDWQTEFVINDSQLNAPDCAILNFSEYQKFTAIVDETEQTITSVNEQSENISITLETVPASGKTIHVSYQHLEIERCQNIAQIGEVKECVNFGDFKKYFGGDFLNPDEEDTKGQNALAHAVYGFFQNGGTRCYVAWTKEETEVKEVLEKFDGIDDISIVAAPGSSNQNIQEMIKTHCENMGDRIAVLDSNNLTTHDKNDISQGRDSDYAALYYPWIQVKDPASNKNILVPPSGHIAGVYARVDNQRGVHKAPANETIRGALELPFNISKAQQDGLNPQGINCIRKLNGNIKIWGARTLGGNANGEFKYVNVRRYFNYLKRSIDEGTQWTVFEPNTPELWARIRRNITAFLTNEWRQGALFGTSPEQAFFVKCDEENNPPEVRDVGQVVTEIGVSVIKPAEFVIFQLSQWTAGN